MKVCVYAISKNEEKFARRWAENMSEADEIYVLDTGSTDKTVEILLENGVNVEQKTISPWRFDSARNESLALVPTDADICVCTDLDELFESGWRKKVEQAWDDVTTSLKYRYTWSFNSDGSEGVVFWIEKIHARENFRWIHPVHEVLEYSGNQPFSKFVEGVQLNHYPDKEKSRGQYLPLLELSVAESPEDDRNMHYLGREYMFNERFQEAIETLKRHLALKTAIWKDERCASMRFIGRCFSKLGNMTKAYKYYLMAIAEAPYLREPWLDMAYFEYYRENWLGAAYFIEYALKIKERPKTYITEANSWNSVPYDVLSIAYYKLGNIELAIENVKKAIRISDESRLKNNLKIFQQGKI
ncbi:MAG: glycosyltransferase family 2 protein [Clostridia bacterium]|nr:glycosyltransferase family 2 protein [Clostridia bacterium]